MPGRFSASGRCNKNAPYFVGMVFGGLLPYVTFLFSWDYAIIIADKSCLLPWQRNDAWSSFGNRHSVYKKVHLVPDARILGLCYLFPLLDRSFLLDILYSTFYSNGICQGVDTRMITESTRLLSGHSFVTLANIPTASLPTQRRPKQFENFLNYP